MKHYLGFSLRNLKRRKLLTFLTLIAIILSVGLISVLGILSHALTASQIAQAEALSGRYHVMYKGLTEETVDKLKTDQRIEQFGTSKPVGHAALPNENFSVTLEETDPVAFELLSLNLLQGRYPLKPNELVLDEQTLALLGIPFAEGTPVELNMELSRLNAEDGSFSSIGADQHTFVLTGVMKNHPAAVSGRYGLGFTGAGTFPQLGDLFSAFVRFKTGIHPVEASRALYKQLGLKDWQLAENNWLLAALGSYDEEGDGEGAAGGLTRSSQLVGALVLLAAGLVIYNIFQVSVVQRTREFGMLRAVGATPTQVRRLVLNEALLLCLIGIPLGLITGTLASSSVVGQVSTILSPDVLGVDSAEQAAQVVQQHIGIPWLWLLTAAGIGLAATLLAAMLPARLASRVPPVTAISGLSAAGASRFRRRKSSRADRHFLWQLAKLNLSRSRGRTAVTVISLTMAIITYVTLQSFVQSLNPMEMLADSMDSAYSLSGQVGIPDADIAHVRSLPGVSHVRTAVEIPEPYDVEAHKAAGLTTKEESQAYTITHTQEVLGYDDGTLETILGALGKNAPTLAEMKEKPLALVWNKEVNQRFSADWQPPAPGSKLVFLGQDITVAGAVDNIAIHRPYTPLGLTLLMHESQARLLAPEKTVKFADLFLKPNITEEEQNQLKLTLEAIQQKTPNCTLTSLEQTKAELIESLSAIRKLGFGLISLISIIGALNIMNTTITSLHTRRAELGTGRAIGMSMQQMNRLILLESLHYGLRALVLGLPIGILLSALTMSMTRGLDSWQPPVMPVLSATLAAVALCLAAAVPPLAAMRRMTIVESISRVD
jgi:putative ABC transport system permease protein